MTNLFLEEREDGKSFLNSVRRTAAAGFKVMDFCMCPFQRHETELIGDDWEALTYEIANEAAKLGVEFSQSHLPYAKPNSRRKTPFDEGCEQNEFFVWATERAIRISGMLGVKWAVVHPVSAGIDPDGEASLKYNHEIYDKYVELASSMALVLPLKIWQTLMASAALARCPTTFAPSLTHMEASSLVLAGISDTATACLLTKCPSSRSWVTDLKRLTWTTTWARTTCMLFLFRER